MAYLWINARNVFLRLSGNEQPQMFVDSIEQDYETEEDVINLERSLDEAARERGIPDDQLSAYMVTRRAERRRVKTRGRL